MYSDVLPISVPKDCVVTLRAFLSYYLNQLLCLVVNRVVRIRQVKDDGRVRTGASSRGGKDLLEVDSAVEAETAVREDINPMALVIARSVQDRDLFVYQQTILKYGSHIRVTHITKPARSSP